MFGLSLTELLVILAIVLLLFGTKKLRNLGGDLGGAIKGFRSAMTDDEKKQQEADADKADASKSEFLEGEAASDRSTNASARTAEHATDRKN
ncbi:MAG TPA: twin-arginine translocase TatA/TatE family subunit [Pseudomonadales bacterium]|nr:twin-arginine translocase TatA/TatE family subunit [Pseudomonadales bacterium]